MYTLVVYYVFYTNFACFICLCNVSCKYIVYFKSYDMTFLYPLRLYGRDQLTLETLVSASIADREYSCTKYLGLMFNFHFVLFSNALNNTTIQYNKIQ